MDKILYIGGVASNRYQINSVSRELSDHYDLNVIGMSFSEAQKDRALVARLAADSLVITHSAGLMMLKDITPQEVIAIAPPMPVSAFLLTVRSVPKTIALLKSYENLLERKRKIYKYNLHAAREHIIRPRYNVGQIVKLGAFNAAKEAIAMTANGSKVTLCFMDDERVFINSSKHHHVELAKEHGVIVHENVSGHHDDFLLYPLEILAQINRL
jgi:hypothetical protein